MGGGGRQELSRPGRPPPLSLPFSRALPGAPLDGIRTGTGGTPAHSTFPDDFHHSGRRIEKVNAALAYRRHPASQPAYPVPVLGHLLRGRGAFHGQQPATDPAERETPARQPVQRGNRTGGNHVGRTIADDGGGGGEFLGAGSAHRHRSRQAESRHHLVQELGPPGQRFDQPYRKVGPRDREYHTGQTGAGPHIENNLLGWDQLRDHRAVEQMPLPDTGCLAGTDKPTQHAFRGEELGIGNGEWKPVAENRLHSRVHRRWHGHRLVGSGNGNRPG